MQLPYEWEIFLDPYIDLDNLYRELSEFVAGCDTVIPEPSLIFNVFKYVSPDDLNCILYGEDPYPRQTSANGVAFWDREIKSWNDKTNGNALKNILKALLVYKGLATYNTTISECRGIAERNSIPLPDDMFRLWLEQGVLLVNTSLTFSGNGRKTEHIKFWRDFHERLIEAVSAREKSPYYILWGNKARQWEPLIRAGIDDTSKIIVQGHPTFIHHFLSKEQPQYSPFFEITEKTGLRWI